MNQLIDLNTIPRIALGCGVFTLAYALIAAVGCRRGGRGTGLAVAALLPRPAGGPPLVLYVLSGLIAWLGAEMLNRYGSWIGAGFAAGVAGFLIAEWINRRLVLAASLDAAAGGEPGRLLSQSSRRAAAAALVAAGLALVATAGYFEAARVVIGLDDSVRGLQGLAAGSLLAGMLLRAGDSYRRTATIGAVPGLYEIFVLTLVTVMSLARQSFLNAGPWLGLPILVGTVAVVAAFCGALSVGRRPTSTVVLFRAMVITLIVAAGILYYGLVELPSSLEGGDQFASVPGLLSTLPVGLMLSGFWVLIFEYYSSVRSAPVKAVAAAATEGHDAGVLAGLGVGMRAPAVSLLAVGCAFGWVLYLSRSADYGQAMFNMALAVLALLPMAAITGCFVLLGDIAACAGVAAESAAAPEREAVETLLADSRSICAFSRSYAVAFSVLLALLLVVVFARSFPVPVRVDATNPSVLMGILAGGLLPYFMGGLALVSTARSNVSGWGGGRLLRSALLGLLPVLVPVGVGLLAGKEALGGFVLGCVVVGLFQAIGMAAAGESWGGARSYVEQGMFGGRLSPAHEAVMTGAGVGASCRHLAASVLVPLTGLVSLSAALVAPLLN